MECNLTSGKIESSLIKFSLPMIVGNLIQQLYNMADTLIVGKGIGPDALAAVGSSYALMVLLTSIVLGLCIGSSVVFSQLYGANKIDDMKISIYNAFVFTALFSFIINSISFLMLDNFIKWLNIPQQAVEMTREYLKIILGGMFFVTIYNFVAAVLRSIGNTVMPLVFLAVAAFTNIILDIAFVMHFGMGVAGAAIATVISQALSAICITVYFFAKGKNLCPEKRHLHFDKKLLKSVINNSSLTAIQQSIMNFGILLVQGLVNSFGFYASAAFAVVVKIDAFAYMPAQDFGNAFSTFVAQNYGAKAFDRIKKGAIAALKISSIFCVIASVIVVVFSRELMLMFINEQETAIINIGVQYLYIVGTTYIGIGILFLLYGFYRGLGRSQMSIVLTIISLGSRVALAYLLSSSSMGMLGIWYAVPIGWALADIFGIYKMRGIFIGGL
ncbi:MAG: MATE family efflux transporter [Ruminococcaceae bacterium]|nr:MATE family efflux transporter [Oscillospiraceae bacterium]